MQYLRLISELQNLTNNYISVTDLSKILGCSVAKVSARKTRNSNFNDAEIEKIEKFYNISFNQQNVDNNIISLEPLHGSCGGGCIVSGNLISNYLKNSKYAIVNAVGDSMHPTIKDNDFCIVQKYNQEQIKDGSIYYFSFGDEFFIKRLFKNINQLEVVSDNANIEKIVLKEQELDKISIVGQVVNIIRGV